MRGMAFTILAGLLCLSGARAQVAISIDESKIHAALKEDSTVVQVPVANWADHPVRANLSLEWLDWDDAAKGSIQKDIVIPPGKTVIEVPLPIQLASIWMRLRYALTPDRKDARVFAPLRGILALPQIADYVFEVKSGYSGAPQSGSPITIHAEAVHPFTRLPLKGLEWKAELSIDDQDIAPIRVSLPADGFADFTFDLPAGKEGAREGQATFDISARIGDFERRISSTMQVPARLTGRFQSDKPIYQPGQTMHLRALVMDAQGRAAPGAKVTLRVDDPESERAHTANLVSSRFGVVQDDWPIPASGKNGDYEITLVKEGDDEYQIARHVVRLSRYELPTFSVAAKPDRGAYLPGQAVRVSITATYLFGKPVPGGKVRVVRTDGQEESDQAASEGEADHDGTFVAQLDLKSEQEELRTSEDVRFNDLHFAAYYTDPTSGRTEQRRFDVRLTREAIHIYVIRGEGGGPLPAPVYISTSYADGTPASATVDIVIDGRTTSLQTNRYGIGKALITTSEQPEMGAEIRARDSTGRTGSSRERFWPDGTSLLRLESKRTIYRAGDSVTLDVTSPPEAAGDQTVMIEAIAGGRALGSRMARLVNHKGEVTFPYQPEFRRTVVFAAWNASDPRNDYRYNSPASRAVLFPDGSDLSVTVNAGRAVYKPGESASLRMQANSRDGKPVEAAFGLAVVDQAVLERARTDNEFGSQRWFACAYCVDEGESEIGGVRLKDLHALKPSFAISPELDLVAEALVARAAATSIYFGGENMRQFMRVVSQMGRLRSILDQRYAESLQYPHDTAELEGILGREWSGLRDPWDQPYTAKFSVMREKSVMAVLSSGPDKLPGTADDFVVSTFERHYFAPVQHLIERILKTGENYPASDEAFRKLLKENGLLLESLQDPWGTPYRARVNTFGPVRSIDIFSAGPDHKFETQDDFSLANFSGNYFRRESAAIAKALFAVTQPPLTVEEFRRILNNGGIDLSIYRDSWDRPYRLESAISSRYGDKLTFTTIRDFGDPAGPHTVVTPVTQKMITFSLRSAGPDGLMDTFDDFDVASFPFVLTEDSGSGPKKAGNSATTTHGAGAISGVVADPTGAVIPGASVTVTNGAQMSLELVTDQEGRFHSPLLAPGVYSLRVMFRGFVAYEVSSVPVSSALTTEISIELQVGAMSEAVMVESSAVALQTSLAQTIAMGPVATPRVRDYFPETLLWLPEIITDAHGAARAQFVLADSVTTWKVAVIASTLDGRVAEAESDLRAFQPFFLDFNPPAVLTEGDKIEVPVTIRNYLNHELKATASIKPNEWSVVEGPAAKDVQVAANNSVNVAYSIRAKSAQEKAVQRITANAGSVRDAIEKSLRVHPDGQEVTQGFGDFVIGPTDFKVAIPQAAIAGATRAELRLYPNMASLLLESASAILIRPHGCAEQTIAGGYANLVAWRFAKAMGITDSKIGKAASANVRIAIDGLNGFRDPQGGVRYWAMGDPDAAVTALALSFLIEASAAGPVDQQDIRSLVHWLESHQAGDGTWAGRDTHAELTGRQTVLLTSLVLRSLTQAQKAGLPVRANVIAGAYHHVALFTDQIDEPYMLAQFILAALDSGDEGLLGNAVARLRGIGRQERGGMYWDLRSNSPFYGWGTAGRYESTGLAVSALSAWRARHAEATDLDPAIRGGLVFLLRGRDADGGWYSTQSTLRAMRAIADASQALGSFGGHGGSIEMRVNGRTVKSVPLPGDPKAMDPILTDVSSFLRPGENRIELVPSKGTQGALMHLSSTHWTPWPETKARSSPELRLAVQFDHLNARVGEPVRCSVTAERVGFRGYGMMLAEIGIPPAAEVDRASLESLIQHSSVDRYDVLPDRVVLYLWPVSGGVSFDFLLRARMPMAAKSGASILYDYYNPEALTEVVPAAWIVK